MVASHGRPLAERCDLQIAGIFDSHEDIVHGAAYTADALGDPRRPEGVGALTEACGALKLALMDIVADAVHEGAVLTAGAAYGEPALHKYIYMQMMLRMARES